MVQWLARKTHKLAAVGLIPECSGLGKAIDLNFSHVAQLKMGTWLEPFLIMWNVGIKCLTGSCSIIPWIEIKVEVALEYSWLAGEINCYKIFCLLTAKIWLTSSFFTHDIICQDGEHRLLGTLCPCTECLRSINLNAWLFLECWFINAFLF